MRVNKKAVRGNSGGFFYARLSPGRACVLLILGGDYFSSAVFICGKHYVFCHTPYLYFSAESWEGCCRALGGMPTQPKACQQSRLVRMAALLLQRPSRLFTD